MMAAATAWLAGPPLLLDPLDVDIEPVFARGEAGEVEKQLHGDACRSLVRAAVGEPARACPGARHHVEAGFSLLLMAVALLACNVPVRRAGRVEASEALRAE